MCIVNNTSLGVALIDDEINALTDYSYINTRFRDSDSNIGIASCMTGLGPNGNDNGLLGGLYFNGNRIPNRGACSSAIVQPIPSTGNAGIININ